MEVIYSRFWFCDISPVMTLTQLRYLVAIADADLNITLAAARIHATQPGLSKQLKSWRMSSAFCCLCAGAVVWSQ